MPRLTPEEYTSACELGFNPDRLNLDQLAKVRSYRPPLKGIEADSLTTRVMGYQPELFATTPEPPPRQTITPKYPSGATVKERFQIFHERNPHVYSRLRRLALQLRRRGRTNYGIKALIEVLRWDYALRTDDDTPLKINNAYATPYAYRIMEHEPELQGFFRTRQRNGDTHDITTTEGQ
tara:strand:+ start:3942 stop:4478 length:537 start_codon:yes stop_codon:yes gene_type:complete